MSNWTDAVRARGVAEVAAAFGLKVVRRTLSPCPLCKAEKRGSSDPRGPVGLRADGQGWECHRCHEGGSAVTLATAIVMGETKPLNWAPVRERCMALGLVDGPHANQKARQASYAAPRPKPQEKPPEAPKRPPEAEVRGLWERCRPITDDARVREWIEGRGLDAETVAGLDLCRALPVSGALPGWAKYMGRSWRESSHRVIVPLYGADGRMASLHARTVNQEAAPKDKAASPAGAEVRGLVMADANGMGFLAGKPKGIVDIVDMLNELATAEGHRGPAGPHKVIVAEGVPDFLTWATHYCEMEIPPGVFGVIAGSWTPEIAAKIPNGCRVTIRTHHDEAGNKYAAKIRETLEGRATLLRSKAHANANTEVRGNDETQGR